MRIIGCDLHSRQQTLAMLDTATGEVEKTTLKHEEQQRARVLFQASTAGACGDRSHRIDAVVREPHGRTRDRMSGGSSGRDSSGRATKTKA